MENTPWVDNSCKWAGGGLLSTAPDLVQMANHLADIYMGRFHDTAELAVVSRNTLVNCLWHPNRGTIQGQWLPGGLYGLGWFIARQVDEAPLVVCFHVFCMGSCLGIFQYLFSLYFTLDYDEIFIFW